MFTFQQRIYPLTKTHHVNYIFKPGDVIDWKHCPRYWPFVRGIPRSPVNSPHECQWYRALMFSLIYAWTNGWANHRDAGDWRCHRPHYDVTVINAIFWQEIKRIPPNCIPWWRHQMETFSASLAICAGNSPITGEFPAQRAVTRGFGVFFDLRLNKRLSKQWRGWWFETPSRSIWRHCNAPPNIV